MRHLVQDWIYACRKLRQSPGGTLAAVLILALAAGTNAAIYTIADNFYVGSPVGRADEVVLVGARFRDPAMNYFYRMNRRIAEALQEKQQSFEVLARVSYYQFTLSGIDQPLRGNGLRVGPGFSEVLSLPVVRGRTFATRDFSVDAEKTAVIAHHVWMNAFGGADDAVGTLVAVNGVPYRIIGVLAERFMFEHGRYEIISASSFKEPTFLGIAGQNLWLAGRLKPNVTVGQAKAEVQSLETGLAPLGPPQYFEENMLGVRRAGERSHTISQRQLSALIMAGAIILLTAALNLCGAAVVRINRRRSEWATRVVLGASRWRLVRLFTIETATLVFGGYLLGLLVGYALVQVVRTRFVGAQAGLLALLNPEEIRLNWRIFVFTALACVAVVLLIAAATYLFSSPRRLERFLKEETRSATVGRAFKWTSGSLLFLQVAATCALMIVGGFFMLSLQRAATYDYGYSPDGLVQAEVFLPYFRFERRDEAPELVPMFDSVLTAVRQFPEVTDARISKLQLPHWGELEGIRLRTTPADVADDNLPQAREGVVGPGFLEMIGVKPVRGALFTEADNRPAAEPVVVVNQAFAAQFYKNVEPIGQFIDTRGARHRVIGVSTNIRRWQIGSGVAQGVPLDTDEPVIYFQTAQSGGRTSAYLYVKTDHWNQDLEQRIRAAVHAINADIVVGRFGDLRTLFEQSENSFKLLVFVQALVAGIGSLLSCLAIYAAVSYWVAQRRREIGIRLALGARPNRIGREVLGYTARLVLPAALVGGIIAYIGLVRLGLLQKQLYLVDLANPLVYLAGGLGLAIVGLLASLHPAVRAASTAPNEVLREG